MGKRIDTGNVVVLGKIGYTVRVGKKQDGTEYKSRSYFIIVEGERLPRPLRAASSIVDGKPVVWLDCGGQSLNKMLELAGA